MNRKLNVVAITISLLIFFVSAAFAQNTEYRLNVRRNFGYSSGNQIRGAFTIDIIGPDNIKSVRFLIDGKLMADIPQAPFSLSFDTANYPFGNHELSAVITTTDGGQVNVQPRTFDFATPEQEGQVVTNLVFPLLGIVLLITLGGLGFQLLVLRKQPMKDLPPGTPRNYGLHGGTICPRCHRPYGLHWWSFHLLTLRFDRCDFCGKWAFVGPKRSEDLRKAEQAELNSFSQEPALSPKTEEEKLKDLVDQSRFTDHT